MHAGLDIPESLSPGNPSVLVWANFGRIWWRRSTVELDAYLSKPKHYETACATFGIVHVRSVNIWLQASHEVVALAGFHIKRQEFEPEYDNEAEMIVADMEFKDDDTQVIALQTHVFIIILVSNHWYSLDSKYLSMCWR